MKNIGIVSYNIHCNFTNYGSALQSWALNQMIGSLGYRSVLVDYCPDVLKDANPLDPFKKMWDKDEESRRMCELTMPAIRENYAKFERFYTERFNRTKKVYTAENFSDVVADEDLSGFVCGSDTIFCVDEFGIDDGYYANYPCMRGKSISYAASFGDSHFTSESYSALDVRLGNFRAIGIREPGMLEYIKARVNVNVSQVLDPTLLMEREDFQSLAKPCKVNGPFLLLYARRYDPRMEAYAEEIAKDRGLKIVEISLRATNADKGHEMRYDAGVEEFLGLVSGAACVVTNSYHGMISAYQLQTPFTLFSREQCDTKIDSLMTKFELKRCKSVWGARECDFDNMRSAIESYRRDSIGYLQCALTTLVS